MYGVYPSRNKARSVGKKKLRKVGRKKRMKLVMMRLLIEIKKCRKKGKKEKEGRKNV